MTSRTRVGGLALLDLGEGPTLVMLHGIGGSADSCRRAAELLVSDASRRVLCVDAPGYGDSDDPASDVDHVAAVVALLDELGLEQVDLFGTSWGGVIATLLTARHPDRVRSLILADSTRGSATSAERAAAMRDRVRELTELGSQAFAARRAPRLVSPHAAAQTLADVERTMAQVRVSGYRAAAEFMAGTDSEDVLAAIDRPTLVLVGEDDVVTGVEESRLLASAIPGARFVLVERAGHSAVTERPDVVAAAISSFWEEL